MSEKKKNIKETDIYFTQIKHTEELTIIGKATELKQRKQEEQNNK